MEQKLTTMVAIFILVITAGQARSVAGMGADSTAMGCSASTNNGATRPRGNVCVDSTLKEALKRQLPALAPLAFLLPIVAWLGWRSKSPELVASVLPGGLAPTALLAVLLGFMLFPPHREVFQASALGVGTLWLYFVGVAAGDGVLWALP
jgi:hypothetical protein